MANGYYNTQMAGAAMRGIMTSYNRALGMQANINQLELQKQRYAVQDQRYADSLARQQSMDIKEEERYQTKLKAGQASAAYKIGTDRQARRTEYFAERSKLRIAQANNPDQDFTQFYRDLDAAYPDVAGGSVSSIGGPRVDRLSTSAIDARGSLPTIDAEVVPQRNMISAIGTPSAPRQTADSGMVKKYGKWWKPVEGGLHVEMKQGDYGLVATGEPRSLAPETGIFPEEPKPTPAEIKETATEAVAKTSIGDLDETNKAKLKRNIGVSLENALVETKEKHGVGGQLTPEQEDEVFKAKREEIYEDDSLFFSKEDKERALETVDEIAGRIDPTEATERQSRLLEKGIWRTIESGFRKAMTLGIGPYGDHVYSLGQREKAIDKGSDYIVNSLKTTEDKIKFVGPEARSGDGTPLAGQELDAHVNLKARKKVRDMIDIEGGDRFADTDIVRAGKAIKKATYDPVKKGVSAIGRKVLSKAESIHEMEQREKEEADLRRRRKASRDAAVRRDQLERYGTNPRTGIQLREY